MSNFLPDKNYENIVETQNLSIRFPIKNPLPFMKKNYVDAVTDVSIKIKQGETFGVVGESGCGKTTLANAILGMVKPASGKIFFKGEDLNALDNKNFIAARRDMQMIFQDPFSSLNPRFDVYQLISEPMYIRGGHTKEEMETRVIDLLKLVGLREEDLHRHVGDFSGGQRQRIGIARAIILNPDFLVCDEPVSALDVSVHAQILNLLMDLQKQMNMTYLFISHNLAVVRSVCKRMAVMYLGKVMEYGDTKTIFNNPVNIYTKALLSAVLDTDIDNKRERIILSGDIPSPINPPQHCRFYQRCPMVMDICNEVTPQLIEIEPDHYVACHKFNK